MEKTADPEEVEKINAALSPIGRNTDVSVSMDEAKYLAENTIQSSFPTVFEMIAPTLCKMQYLIFDTNSTPVFVTSDNPCVWVDPELPPEGPWLEK